MAAGGPFVGGLGRIETTRSVSTHVRFAWVQISLRRSSEFKCRPTIVILVAALVDPVMFTISHLPLDCLRVRM